MYERDAGWLGFSWSSMDRRERRLAAATLTALLVGAALFIAEEAGRAIASAPGQDLARKLFVGPSGTLMAVTAILALIVSGLSWWRFSRLQDEMFNRAQNHALGMASTITLLAFTGCSLLGSALGREHVSAGFIMPLWSVLTLFFLRRARADWL